VTIATNRESRNRSIVALPVILADLILMGLLFACSTTNPDSPDASQGGGGTAPSVQTPAPSNPGPAANSGTSGSAQPTGASPSSAPARHLLRNISSASVQRQSLRFMERSQMLIRHAQR
jgi:hypothetical protein